VTTARQDHPWRAPDEAVAALLAARHPDPFALLGPHATPAGLVLRAFLPGAEALEALPEEGGAPIPIAARPGAPGFFEAPVPDRTAPFRYRLRARRDPAEGRDAAWEFEDPYAFGPTLGPLDDHLLVEGTHRRLHDRLGAHPVVHEGVAGVRFAVRAPHAARVSVVGLFNAWDGRRHPMRKRLDSGIWEIFLPGLGPGDPYKYEILAADGRLLPLKADPFGQAAELRPANASVVSRGLADFPWTDAAWLAARAAADPRRAPISVYEVHAGSWRRGPDGGMLGWDELADSLLPYAAGLGFTHVQLMPVSEHPFDGSWGYQPIGIYAPTARHGAPEGLARFVDRAHAMGLGVFLDWVPAHFPQDDHGLRLFDGTPLFEHPDPRRGLHPEWGTAAYDYGRREVAAFLIANALYWLDRFHADGLRVDAVSSMLYLDYGRGEGQWAPNPDGSNDNRDAVAFLRACNAAVAEAHPGALMMAEEATAWRGVTHPARAGGLGFGFKWNMGWMNDSLRYLKREPIHRRWHHGELNWGLVYAFDEAFILPLSHDEVVHGKGSLIGRIPGDDWQRFATLRCQFGFMWGHPGKKLLFMGGEIAQWREWSEARALDWHLLDFAPHRGVQALVADLNRLYRGAPALHAQDCAPEGFRWIDPDDSERSILSFLRLGAEGDAPVAVLCNFTPMPRAATRIGLPRAGVWREVLNTDAAVYGGSGLGNLGAVTARAEPAFGFPASAEVMVPPLATIYLMAESP
jgi:1,4-alpha-glucan branching enzyme